MNAIRIKTRVQSNIRCDLPELIRTESICPSTIKARLGKLRSAAQVIQLHLNLFHYRAVFHGCPWSCLFTGSCSGKGFFLSTLPISSDSSPSHCHSSPLTDSLPVSQHLWDTWGKQSNRKDHPCERSSQEQPHPRKTEEYQTSCCGGHTPSSAHPLPISWPFCQGCWIQQPSPVGLSPRNPPGHCLISFQLHQSSGLSGFSWTSPEVCQHPQHQLLLRGAGTAQRHWPMCGCPHSSPPPNTQDTSKKAVKKGTQQPKQIMLWLHSPLSSTAE